MSGPRAAKLAAALREELSALIGREVKDPRVQAAGLMTLTEVRLSPDLKHATVWVSFVGAADEAVAGALAGLGRAAGFLRGEAGRRLGLKRSPELRFVQDRSAETAQHIDELLRSDPPSGGGEES